MADDVLFALGVEVYPADFSLDLVEADVVEALETRAGYGPNSMIGDQKVFLPSHEDMFSLGGVSNQHGALACLLLEGTEGREFGPMTQVDLYIGTPIIMLREEGVLRPNDFALKVRREGRVVFGEAYL